MKVITKYIFTALAVLLFSCDDELENRPSYEESGLLDYVRYALMLDSSGDPIEDPNDQTEPYVNTYTHSLYDTIYIPIYMTRADVSSSVSVNMKNTVYGDDQSIRFVPDSVIVFGKGKSTDTIEVIFDKRWFVDIKDSIVMEILSSSDTDMFIGYPYGDSLSNKLTIHLGEIEFPMTTSKPYSHEILDSETPSFEISVDFENGFVYDEIVDQELWKEVSSSLDYTLTQHDFEDGDNSITYTFTLNTPVENKYTNDSTILELAEINGYQVSGNSTLEFFFTGLPLKSFTLVDDLVYIQGDLNETVNIEVRFASPIDQSVIDAIETDDLLKEENSSMQYHLERQPMSEGDTSVVYIYTLLEDLSSRNSELFETIFTLNSIEGFSFYGNTSIEIEKSPLNTGSNSVNPASNFYNYSNPTSYSLFYNYMWFDYGADDDCEWRETFMHTYPVEVEATDPDAVLHSNGKYYHAYRFGFNSPNAGRTTNGMSLKHWFEDEYISADLSPGFNIPEALELFPKDGTSRTEGIVQVVEQDLIISNKSGNVYTFGISGDGAYSYDEGSYEIYRDSIYTIDLQFSVTNEELYGGTRTKTYHMKNRDMSSLDKPDSLYIPCYAPVTL